MLYTKTDKILFKEYLSYILRRVAYPLCKVTSQKRRARHNLL